MLLGICRCRHQAALVLLVQHQVVRNSGGVGERLCGTFNPKDRGHMGISVVMADPQVSMVVSILKRYHFR